MSLIIEAWREEAALYRHDGKEQAARQLERLAERTAKFINQFADVAACAPRAMGVK